MLMFPVKTPLQGAQTTLFTALAPNLEKYSGMYFADCAAQHNSNPLTLDKDVAKRLWQLSEKQTGVQFP